MSLLLSITSSLTNIKESYTSISSRDSYEYVLEELDSLKKLCYLVKYSYLLKEDIQRLKKEVMDKYPEYSI